MISQTSPLPRPAGAFTRAASLGALLFLPFFLGAAADPRAAQLAEIESALAAVEAERSAIRAEREQHETRIESLERRLERRRAEVRDEKRAAATESLEELRRGVEKDEREIENWREAIAPRAKTAERLLVDWRREIERGISWRRAERLETIDGAIELLGDDDAAAQMRGLERLATILGDEIRALREREIWNDLVLLDGSYRHAWLARLGLAIEIFVTEDEKLAGFTARGEGAAQVAAGEADAAVRSTFRMLDRRAEPALVELPVERIEAPNEEAPRP